MKPERISVLHRKLLHRLLHRDLRQCSVSELASAQHRGWISGLGGGYELTQRGRQVAEYSEQADSRGGLEVGLLGAVKEDPAGPVSGGFGDRSGKGRTGGQYYIKR